MVTDVTYTEKLWINNNENNDQKSKYQFLQWVYK